VNRNAWFSSGLGIDCQPGLRRIVAWENLPAAYFLFRVLLDLTWIKAASAASKDDIPVMLEPTNLPLVEIKRMMRALLFAAMAFLCASCRTDTQLDPIQITTPILDTAEISGREDCLYREVERLLEPKGSPPTSLQNVAVAAARFCSEAVRSRFQRASVSAPDAQKLARDDQIKTEQRAFAIGLELRAGRNAGLFCEPICEKHLGVAGPLSRRESAD
jgi:hypothetical protein